LCLTCARLLPTAATCPALLQLNRTSASIWSLRPDLCRITSPLSRCPCVTASRFASNAFQRCSWSRVAICLAPTHRKLLAKLNMDVSKTKHHRTPAQQRKCHTLTPPINPLIRNRVAASIFGNGGCACDTHSSRAAVPGVQHPGVLQCARPAPFFLHAHRRRPLPLLPLPRHATTPPWPPPPSAHCPRPPLPGRR